MKKRRPKNRNHVPAAKTPPSAQPRNKRLLSWLLAVLLLAVLVTGAIFSMQSGTVNPVQGERAPIAVDGRKIGCKTNGRPLTTSDLLDMPDAALERMSLIEMNAVVQRDMPECKDLDIGEYEQRVNAWTEDFRSELPKMDAMFYQHPEKWKNDIDLFHFGSIMDYMGARLKMVYDPQMIHVPGGARYTDPKWMFVSGLIRDRKGTCANMPVLQAAIARKLGWPVSLVPIQSHYFCRWDDGKKHLNIETTQTDKGGFSSNTDAEYAQMEKVSAAMQKSSLDLHTLTARQILGMFIMNRGRVWLDRGEVSLAYADFGLAMGAIPNHRELVEMMQEVRGRLGEMQRAEAVKREMDAISRLSTDPTMTAEKRMEEMRRIQRESALP